MTMEDGFSTKEIVILINNKLDKFMEVQDTKDIKQDERIGGLERYTSKLTGGLKILAFTLSGSGLIAVGIALLRIFVGG